MGNREKELYKTSLNSILINLALFIIKLIAGLKSQSTAVISDAIHTLSDALSTILVMIGIKISSKDADENHPYGHYKFESIISFLLALILAYVGYQLAVKGVKSLLSRRIIEPSLSALLATIISIGVKEFLFYYSRSKAIKHQSSSMMADAWHHRSDSVSSIAVLIGLISLYFGWWFMEPLSTLFVSLLLFKVSYDIFILAMQQITDYRADPQVEMAIKEKALTITEVQAIDLLRTRLSNNIIIVELEIAVNPNLSVQEGHHIAHLVQEAVMTIPNIQYCSVHVNPYEEESTEAHFNRK